MLILSARIKYFLLCAIVIIDFSTKKKKYTTKNKEQIIFNVCFVIGEYVMVVVISFVLYVYGNWVKICKLYNNKIISRNIMVECFNFSLSLCLINIRYFRSESIIIIL